MVKPTSNSNSSLRLPRRFFFLAALAATVSALVLVKAFIVTTFPGPELRQSPLAITVHTVPQSFHSSEVTTKVFDQVETTTQFRLNNSAVADDEPCYLHVSFSSDPEAALLKVTAVVFSGSVKYFTTTTTFTSSAPMPTIKPILAHADWFSSTFDGLTSVTPEKAVADALSPQGLFLGNPTRTSPVVGYLDIRAVITPSPIELLATIGLQQDPNATSNVLAFPHEQLQVHVTIKNTSLFPVVPGNLVLTSSHLLLPVSFGTKNNSTGNLGMVTVPNLLPGQIYKATFLVQVGNTPFGFGSDIGTPSVLLGVGESSYFNTVTVRVSMLSANHILSLIAWGVLISWGTLAILYGLRKRISYRILAEGIGLVASFAMGWWFDRLGGTIVVATFYATAGVLFRVRPERKMTRADVTSQSPNVTASPATVEDEEVGALSKEGIGKRGIRSSLLLLSVVSLLMMVGILIQISASQVISPIDRSLSAIALNHLIWLALGVLGLVCAFSFRTETVVARGASLHVMACFLLVMVLVPGVGIGPVLGANRWLQVFGITFQPSNLAKFGLVLFGAQILARARKSDEARRRAFRSLLVNLTLLITLVMLEPDVGTAIVLVIIAGSMMVAANIPVLPLAWAGLGGLGCGSLFLVATPWDRDRLAGFVHPFAHPLTSGYQILLALYAFANGGLIGKGLGNGIIKLGIPDITIGTVFAVVGEEMGFLGAAAVIILFFVFAIIGIRCAGRAPGTSGSLVAVGVTAWITGQAMLNMAGTLGLVPIGSVGLPLFSFEGSGTVAELAAIGLLLRISMSTGS